MEHSPMEVKSGIAEIVKKFCDYKKYSAKIMLYL
jgi:hypothetical protein